MSDDSRRDDPDTADRREGERRAVMIPAAIQCADGQVIPCVLRDTSPGGARLSVPRQHRLPAAFTLAVEGRARTFPVRCMWQRDDSVGVALDPAPPEGTDPWSAEG